ncbi:sugar ABC transporter substrate-binding protein [Dactylosporangium sp. NPDC005572]|uniref:sugar ABC transporter substrate-binding protein n=1 Tax=Dactylosporangium sp. NPDC005572 TaxID=3156889 RepID=UPI0033B35A47
MFARPASRSVLPGRRAKFANAIAATNAIVVLVAMLLAACSSGKGSNSAKDVVLVQSIRSLSNPYHAQWVKGGELYAASIGMKVEVLANEGDSQKQLSQIKSLTASGKTVVANIDPNTSSDAEALVRAVTDAGGYVVTHWNKPDDLHPWDVSDHWVAHVTFDGRVGGYNIAKALFAEMGGTGGIIALQGLPDNVVARDRLNGMTKAMNETPGITLLDQQTGEWDRNKAFQVTQTLLNKHEGKVNGIWAANDNMALGALEALKAAGLQGKVPVVGIDAVPEALKNIQAGDVGYVATQSSDAYWQGSAALALARQAATGQYNVGNAPQSDREFYGEQFAINKDNVGRFLTPPTAADLQDDWQTPLARNQGQITYQGRWTPTTGVRATRSSP